MKTIIHSCLILGMLVLVGCASTVKVTDKLPASADLPEGHGAIVGSILMSAPTDVSDTHKQKMLDSLKAKKYEATIGRFVFHGNAIGGWTEHPGRKYAVPFEFGVEKRFVIQAPAGTYSFQKIVQILRGIFGEGCTMEGVANFNIHTAKTTYIGQLTIVAGFKSDEELRMVQALDSANRAGIIAVPERFLNMKCNVTDMKEETLRGFNTDKPGSIAGLHTELMFVDGRNKWGFKPGTIPATLEVPPRRYPVSVSPAQPFFSVAQHEPTAWRGIYSSASAS